MCSGIAARLGIDPIIVRGIVIVVAVLGGPALLLYAAGWLLLPDADNRIHLERMIRGEFYGALAGIGAIVLLAILPSSQGIWFSSPWVWGGPYWASTVFRGLWTLAVIGALIWFIVWLATRSGAHRTPPPPSGQPLKFSAPDAGARPMGTATAAASAATSATAAASAHPESPAPPASPAPSADPDELAAWKEQQAAWRQEHAVWRAQQAESARAISLEQRRLRSEQNSERREAWVAKQRRTRSNPLFSAIAIGVALIAGAVTALVVGDGGWNLTAGMAGLAVTLGVLGLAIVINGFSGRRSGGASGLAIVAAIALVLAPVSTIFGADFSTGSSDWSPSLSAHTSADRVVLNGDVNLDLSNFRSASTTTVAEGHVNLWLVDSDATVTVPKNVSVELRTHSVNGSVYVEGTRVGGNKLHSIKETVTPSTGKPVGNVELTVWVINGTITIDHETNGN